MAELPFVLSFLGGSLSSSLADLVTFPMDMLKTRMQLGGTQGMMKYTSIRHCVQHTYQTTGASGFFKGLEAALIRQFCSSGIRIALYDKIKALTHDDLHSGGNWLRFGEAALCGGIASFISTPLDVAKIRLINDPHHEKYSGFVDVLVKTYRHDGVLNGFFKGSSPNVYRALLVNASELGTYDNAKALLIEYLGLEETGLLTRFLASLMAGFVASVVTSPIDVVKTRYMNATKPDPTVVKGNEVRYTSPLDCFKKIVRDEGPRALYNGFLLLWLRLGPWCVVMLLSWDLYKDTVERKYRQYLIKQDFKED